jgi:hypothetical protein
VMNNVRAKGVRRVSCIADATAVRLGKTVGVDINAVVVVAHEVVVRGGRSSVVACEVSTTLGVTGARCMLDPILVKVVKVL